MFGKKKSSASAIGNKISSAEETTSQNQTSVITQGTKIEGKVMSSENLRIDGHIIGEVHCKNKLVIGATGRIEGDVWAGDCNLSGNINGNVTLKGTMEMMPTARFRGNLNAQNIAMELGAIYSGACVAGEKPSVQAPSSNGITKKNTPSIK